MKRPTELGKPSILDTSSLFQNVRIAIAHPDRRSAKPIRQVLSSLGCRHISIVTDSDDILALLHSEPIDILVIDWELKPATGIDFVTRLRRAPVSSARMTPVILLTPNYEPDDLIAARNAGVTEYVAKPFTAKSLLESIHAVVSTPRPFIVSASYIGPDRRTASSLTVIDAGAKTRVHFERRPPKIVPAEAIVRLVPGGPPLMVLPDHGLKERIGLEIPYVITDPQTIVASEAALAQARTEFARWVKTDVSTLLYYNRILVQRPDIRTEVAGSITSNAALLGSRMRDMGYRRAADVARLLCEYSTQHFEASSEQCILILEKYVLTLVALISAGQEAGDGPEGNELVKELFRVAEQQSGKSGSSG